jgi:hypothetical protein
MTAVIHSKSERIDVRASTPVKQLLQEAVSVVTKFDGLIFKHRDGPRFSLWVRRCAGRHHLKQVGQKGTSESNIPTSLGCSRSWA